MLRLLAVLVCLGLTRAQVSAPAEPKILTQPLQNIKIRGTQAFVGQITVGTPPQLMPVTFDTSMKDSFVVSVNCRAPVCQARPQYDATLSSTYQADGTPFELPHGQNVSGSLSRDSLGVTGASVSSFSFGEITNVWSDWYNNLPQAGIIGLGRSSPGGETLIDLLAEQGDVPSKQFGLWLGKDPVGGEVTLGGLDEKHFTGELTWGKLLPAADDGYWAVSAGVTFPDRPELTLCRDAAGCTVAPISTTPYFLLSRANADAVNTRLGGTPFGEAGAVALDCTNLYKLPNLHITVSGRVLEVTPHEYTFHLRFPNHMQMCISGFLGVGHLDDNTMLLGTLFMQKYYTAYDAENERLGFADSA